MSYRDRIVELRRVRAGDLAPNPANWRTHPKAQRDALAAVMGQVGIADAVLARQLPDGTLQLIDGHLRQSLDPEQVLPVLVVDLNEAEAATVLATHDPLAAMAGSNRDALDALCAGLLADNDAALASVLGSVADFSSLPSVQALLPQPEVVGPTEFVELTAQIPIDFRCPKCGYEWSGAQAPIQK